MINKLTGRHSYDNIDDYRKYVVQCPLLWHYIELRKR